MIGLERERPAKALFCACEAALAGMDSGQIVVGLGVIGMAFGNRFELGYGALDMKGGLVGPSQSPT